MWFPPVKTRIQAVRAETDKNRKGAATVIYGYVCKSLIAPPRLGGRACGAAPSCACIALSYGVASACCFYYRLLRVGGFRVSFIR